jgi:flagellar operon protein
MNDRITIGQLYTNAVSPAQLRKPVVNGSSQPISGKSNFQTLLDQQLVKFSLHAEQRLKERGIQFRPEQMAQLENAIDRAASKGARDTLMMLNGTALIVNVPNRTVITAMDSKSMKDNVFTQIDSAVIIS